MKCKVTVDVANLKNNCPRSFETAIAKAAPSTITLELDKLVNEPQAFADILCNSIDEISSNIPMMNRVINLYKKSVRTEKLDKLISNKIISKIENLDNKNKHQGAHRRPRYRRQEGKNIPKLLDKCVDLFDDKDRERLLKAIFDKHNHFYSYARKKLALIASSVASSEDDFIKVLNCFYKVMERDTFMAATKNISNGVDNPSVRKILNKTKKFNVCKYSKAEIKASKEKKIELLKDIARSPSSAKNLNFRVSFSTSEIENLAPVMRFNFLKWYYKSRFKEASVCANRPDRLKSRLARALKNSPTNNIDIPAFTEAELQKLLFSVGLKKNEEVSRFKTAYDAYLQIKQGKSMSRRESQQAFTREYSYYYW